MDEIRRANILLFIDELTHVGAANLVHDALERSSNWHGIGSGEH